MKRDQPTFFEHFRSLAKIHNPLIIREELRLLQPHDISEGLQRISISEGLSILGQLESNIAAEVLTKLPKETAKHYLHALPDETVATYLVYLPEDEAIHLHEEIGKERFERILNSLPPEEAVGFRRLLSYPEGSIGRIMTESYLHVSPNDTPTTVLKEIRSKPENEYETIHVLYVLSEDRHLLGVLSLWQMLRADPHETMRSLMNPDIISCAPNTPEEDAARMLVRYEFYALPIVDERGRILGILTSDDAYEILDEADTEDVLKLGAVSGEADAYLSLNAFQIAKRRIPWLLPLFAAGTLSTMVLRYYGTADLHYSVLYFTTLLVGTGGNSGSQVTTTITRAIALGEITISDALVVIRREFAIALIVGSILGLLGYVYAMILNVQSTLAFVIGLTLPCIVIWATLVGSVLPIVAKRIGIDPAVMSAPFITTLVDATGLIIYLELVTRIM